MAAQLERRKKFQKWKNLNSYGEKEQTMLRKKTPAIEYIT